jgi:hypothetical protein
MQAFVIENIYKFSSYVKLKIKAAMLPVKAATKNPFKRINKPDAANSQVYYLSFKYSSTCFGHPDAHHQELNNCSSSLWFYRWSVVVAVLQR